MGGGATAEEQQVHRRSTIYLNSCSVVYSLPAAGDGGGYGGGWLYPAKRANTRSNRTKLVRLIRKKITAALRLS